MAENILMIALSPTMEKGQILKWHKAVGDTISSGDVICEVETDKAAMDYEAAVDGVLLDILVPEGGNAVVGQPIAVIGEEGEKISPAPAPAEDASGTIKIAPEQNLSKAADGFLRIDSGFALETHEDDEEDDEFVFDEPEGANSAEQDLKFIFEGKGALPVKPADSPVRKSEDPEVVSVVQGGKTIKISPLARKIAEQLGLVLSSIVGTGPEGRIVRKDVEEAAKNLAEHSVAVPKVKACAVHPPAETVAAVAAAQVAAAEKPAPAPIPVISDGTVIPVSGKRKLIARRLAESKFSAPHYYLKLGIEMDNILEARERLNENRKGKISLNAFIIKFVAETLKRHPIVNSTWNGDTITLHKAIDIGIAVALPDGLVTPVVRDCGNKGIAAIDSELKVLIEKAKNGTLQTEEYKNPTFTISNLGSYGIEEFTAIINPPGSAILAVGAIKREILVKDDFEEEEDDHIFHVQYVMKATMSCDHRVIDGAAGAEFMRDLKDLMEDPVKLLM